MDLDNLNDQEKVVVWHYFREEYEKEPYSLPIAKETVEQFLLENQELVERL